MVTWNNAPHNSNPDYLTSQTQTQNDPMPQQLNQPQNAELQQIICGLCRKPGHAIKACQKSIRLEQERKGAEQTTKRPNAKTYPPLHIAKELTTQQTYVGMPQTRLIDPKK